MLAYMCTQTRTCILMLSAHMLAPGALTESSCIIYIMVVQFQKAWMSIHVLGNENDQRCHSWRANTLNQVSVCFFGVFYIYVISVNVPTVWWYKTVAQKRVIVSELSLWTKLHLECLTVSSWWHLPVHVTSHNSLFSTVPVKAENKVKVCLGTKSFFSFLLQPQGMKWCEMLQSKKKKKKKK